MAQDNGDHHPSIPPRVAKVRSVNGSLLDSIRQTTSIDSSQVSRLLRQERGATGLVYKTADSVGHTVTLGKDVTVRLSNAGRDSLEAIKRAVRQKGDTVLGKVSAELNGISNADGTLRMADDPGVTQLLQTNEIHQIVNSPINKGLSIGGDLKPADGVVPVLQEDIADFDGLAVLNVDVPTSSEVQSNLEGLGNQVEVPEEFRGFADGTVQVDSAALAEEIEDQALRAEPVAAANREIEKAKAEQMRQQALLQRYRDEKLNREEIVRKAKNVVNSQAKERLKLAQSAQNHIGTIKAKESKIKNLKHELFAESPELTARTFEQRLVPGLMWQVSNREFLIVDASFQTGYQLNNRFTSGIGAVYRFGVGDQINGWIKGVDVFGGRLYVDGNVGKGAFLHAEFEALRVQNASSLIASKSERNFNRVYGSYFGVGKRMNVARHIAFVVQANYRVNHLNELYGVSKVSARFGLEYVFRRPRRNLHER